MEHSANVSSNARGPAGVSITRVLRASRELVWVVWTDAAHVRRWWGPHGFTIAGYAADLRPGGTLRYEMRAPDGTLYPSSGTFEDVVPQERYVTLGVVEIAGHAAFEARTMAAFAENGDETIVTISQTYSNVTRAGADAIDGAHAGWTQQFERLEAYLAGLQQQAREVIS